MPKHSPSFRLQGLGVISVAIAHRLRHVAGHGNSAHTGAAEGRHRRAFAELRGAGHTVPL
jgi:hypothetical protein